MVLKEKGYSFIEGFSSEQILQKGHGKLIDMDEMEVRMSRYIERKKCKYENSVRLIVLKYELSHPYSFDLYCCKRDKSNFMKIINKEYYADGGVSKRKLRGINDVYYYWNDTREKKVDNVPRKYGLRFAVDKSKYVDKLEDLEGEVWKDVPNTEGFYMVSNKGRVKSKKKIGKEIELNKLYSKGYHRVAVSYAVGRYINGKTKYKRVSEFVHKLVAEAFLEKPSDFDKGIYVIDHIDRNKINNEESNLRYATYSQNAKNRSEERIIPDDKLIKYLELYKEGRFSLTELCRYSGYTYSCMESLLKGKKRKHIYKQVFGEI